VESHIRNLKRRTIVYKISGPLLLLPIGLRMEPHLYLLAWILVEVGSLIDLPNSGIRARLRWDEGFASSRRKKLE